jgi:hypothetical protein
VATRASLARSLETIWTQMLRDLLEHRTQSVIHVKEPVPAADAADATDAKPAPAGSASPTATPTAR